MWNANDLGTVSAEACATFFLHFFCCSMVLASNSTVLFPIPPNNTIFLGPAHAPPGHYFARLVFRLKETLHGLHPGLIFRRHKSWREVLPCPRPSLPS